MNLITELYHRAMTRVISRHDSDLSHVHGATLTGNSMNLPQHDSYRSAAVVFLEFSQSTVCLNCIFFFFHVNNFRIPTFLLQKNLCRKLKNVALMSHRSIFELGKLQTQWWRHNKVSNKADFWTYKRIKVPCGSWQWKLIILFSSYHVRNKTRGELYDSSTSCDKAWLSQEAIRNH